ncbi:MAG: SpoIIE family protein phosphatase [Candidatus Sumerlaeia bacterium]|nr:SpoIIE family protein phosphatase [Candidatus Sumerlaeia bacterium]
MPKLSILSGEEAGRIFHFDAVQITIGRSVNNDLQIVDRRMSRNHCQISLVGDVYYVEDMQSKNGSLLNGKPLTSRQILKHGDMIQVGDSNVLFTRTEDSGEAFSSTTPEATVVPGNQINREGSSFRVINEDNWGNTRGEIRVGSRSKPLSIPDTNLNAHEQARHLEIIYEVMEAIRSTFSTDQLLQQIMDLIMKVIKPDRAYLLLSQEGSSELVPEVIRDTQLKKNQEICISNSIVNRCVRESVSLLVSDAAQDARFNASESIIANRIRTAMVAPLIYKEQSLGVVYIDTNTRAFPYLEADLELLTGIANQAAVAIVNARLHSQLVEQHKIAREMEIARTIQMNLLPKVYPTLRGFDVSAMSLPAKHVGGDYYDFIALPDGRIGFAIADVSGKGVPAAILTATTRSYLQSQTQQPGGNLAQTVERINRMVHRDVTNDMYVTMALIYLEPESGEIEYVNAGHSHPVLMTPHGETRFLEEGGLFLGIVEESTYDQAKEKLHPGDVLVLQTDGVMDILNPKGESFGSERFYSIIRQNIHLSAEEIRNAIYQACVQHRAEADQFDDFTLIVLKRQRDQSGILSDDISFAELDLD